MGIDALVTILDAVGVEENEKYLDLGAWDGMLVTGAAMLLAKYLDVSRGVEICQISSISKQNRTRGSSNGRALL